MESGLREEVNAKLSATQARVEQRLTEHTMESNASFEALRREMVDMNLKMSVQFAKIDGQFEAMNKRFDKMEADFDRKLERGIAQVVKWVIGLVGGAMISFITVITFVLNHAS